MPNQVLASLEPREKPKPVMPTSGHEDELQCTKDRMKFLFNPNEEQLKEAFFLFPADTLMIWVEDQLIVNF